MALSANNRFHRLCRSNAFLIGCLGILLLAAYANSFTGGFLIDNQIMILKDPRVQELSWQNLGLIFSKDYWWPSAELGAYRPITKLTFLLNYVIPGGGQNPVGYHVFNLLLQWLNAALLFTLLLRILGGRRFPAFFGAALFALHPVATEAVTNIVGRADQLVCTAAFGAVLCFARGVESGGGKKAAWYAGAGLLVALGYLSKENGIMILALIPFYALAFLPWRRAWRESALSGVAVLPLFGGAWLLRSWVMSHVLKQQFPFADNPLGGADFLTARITAVKVVAHYVRLLVWPRRLSCDYSYNQIPLGSWGDPGFWAGALILVSIAAVLVVAFRRSRPLFFLAGMACLMFLPTSNLLIVIGNIMGERYLYVSLAGFAGGLAMAADRLPGGGRATLAAVLLAACAGRTYVRNADWKDGVSIWQSAVEVCPNNYRAYKALGGALVESDPQNANGSLERAIELMERAKRIMEEPPLPLLRQCIGVYADLGGNCVSLAERLPGKPDAEERLALYRRAVSLLDHAAEIERASTEELREIAIRTGMPTQRLSEGYGDFHIYGNLGLALLRLGEFERSVAAYQRMHELAPADKRGYMGASLANRGLGRADGAIVCLLQALVLDNADAANWSSLFDLYARAGWADVAIIAGAAGAAPKLNMQSDLVRRHVKDAYLGLSRNYEAFGNHQMAAQLRQQAETGAW